MIAEVGHFSLMLGFALALAQAIVPLYGAWRGRAALMAVGRAAARGQLLFVLLSYACLHLLFIANDFSVRLVADNSHTRTPLIYRITAVWGNHEGSMLLWIVSLSLWTAAVTRWSRGLPEAFTARVLGVLGTVSAGFTAFTLLTSNPFSRLLPAAPEGRDLNPLLQDPGMIIHPPLLYLGYVGFSIAFAFAIAALMTGRLDAAWARWSRPWTVAAWVLLTAGIAVGSSWAYYELGWGGWWFWDPVENASFMPWLAGAALLHSAVVTERRGALAGWTVFLALLAFSFSMLGAFLVRSGVLTSVHAFAVDPQRGMMLLAILGLTAGAAFALFAWRAPQLKGGGLFAPVSREGALVLNNLFLTAAAATVLLGTLYPLILEAASGATISVGPPYFAATFVPLMTVAFLILPAGPLLAWKRGDLPGATQRLAVAAGLSLVCALAAYALWSPKKALAAAGIGLGAWLILGALAEVAERARLFRASPAETLRRLKGLPLGAWGMSLAHLGLGVFILGAVVETGFKAEAARALTLGQTVSAGPWTVTLDQVRVVEGPNYLAEQGRLTVRPSNDRGRAKTVTAERRFFPAGGQTTTEVGLDFRGLDDVYVVMGERAGSPDQPAWVVRLYWNPWARLIFLGPMIMALGGLLSLLDRRLRLGVGARRRRPA